MAPTILVVIYWNFTIFQYRSDSPQVKGNFISSIANLVLELPPDGGAYVPTQEKKGLGSQEIRKCQKNLKFGWAHCLAPSLPSETQTSRIAVKKHVKTGRTIKPGTPEHGTTEYGTRAEHRNTNGTPEHWRNNWYTTEQCNMRRAAE